MDAVQDTECRYRHYSSKCCGLGALLRRPAPDALQGYSHGSLIASLHPVLEPPIRTNHILISYPLSPRGWLTLFKSAHYASKLEDLLRNPRARVLIVHGDSDDFTSASTYRTWVDGLRNVADGEGNAQLTVSVSSGTSHFWQGRGQDDLEDAMSRFLSEN